MVRVLFMVVVLCLPGQVWAQYKNATYGFDVGFLQLTTASVLENNGQDLKAPQNRPRRLSRGFQIGGETNYKMDADHWWFTARVNFSFLFYAPTGAGFEADFDEAAKQTQGVIMGIQGMLGVRYVFLTDQFRPYLQTGLSYLRLQGFNSDVTCEGANARFCPSGGTNRENFLPHPNSMPVHLRPGVEIIIARDVALHFFADIQYWLAINAPGNFVFNLGAGMLFFT